MRRPRGRVRVRVGVRVRVRARVRVRVRVRVLGGSGGTRCGQSVCGTQGESPMVD